jgi:hypothetical protein
MRNSASIFLRPCSSFSNRCARSLAFSRCSERASEESGLNTKSACGATLLDGPAAAAAAAAAPCCLLLPVVLRCRRAWAKDGGARTDGRSPVKRHAQKMQRLCAEDVCDEVSY